MGNRPTKFACDVALSGAFGVDRDVSKLSSEERRITKAAVALYKRLRNVVLNGDLYRLESPYERPRASLSYVAGDRSRAVLFIYQLQNNSSDSVEPVKPRGLDPGKRYAVRELNVAADPVAQAEKMMDGQTVMRDGITPPCRKELDSAIFEIVEAK